MKILKDNQGNVLVKNGAALSVPGTSPDLEFPTYTGTVDAEGLAELGWDAEDIAWLQAHVWWNAEDNEYWKVTEANKAFGPNGATPLTWENRNDQKYNPDLRYFPKWNLAPATNTSWGSALTNFHYVVAIPTHGWDVSHVTNFYNLFGGCWALRSLGDLSNWDTSNATNFSSTFNACYNLIDVGDLSNWDTSAVTTMASMFSGCYKLRRVGDLSSWDVSNVTNLSNMFVNCLVLKDVGKLADWNTSKVTTIQSMFTTCYALTRLDLTNWDTSKMTRLDSAFNNCYHLVSVGDLSNWDISSAVNTSSMFYNDYSLCHIGDLSRWDTSNVANMSNMFYNCPYLTSLGDLSNWDTSSVTNLGAVFGGCRYLYPINVANWNVEKATNITNFFNGNLSLDEIDVSGWKLTDCTSAGTSSANGIFCNCYTVKRLKLGSHFFDGTPTTYYFNSVFSWTRDSVYESLYTNQTLRNLNSPAITIRLHAETYDRLSQQDKDDIATKNITLMRG